MSRGLVLLADANALLLDHLEELLAGDFNIVGRVTDCEALVDAVHRMRPQVVLLDIALPPGGGFEAAKQVKAIAPQCKVIFLSLHNDSRYLDKARQVGGLDLLLKQCPSAIAPYIRTLLNGCDAGGTLPRT